MNRKKKIGRVWMFIAESLLQLWSKLGSSQSPWCPRPPSSLKVSRQVSAMAGWVWDSFACCILIWRVEQTFSLVLLTVRLSGPSAQSWRSGRGHLASHSFWKVWVVQEAWMPMLSVPVFSYGRIRKSRSCLPCFKAWKCICVCLHQQIGV